ncbi:hypothetical protein BDQ17DRAFT_1326455 [Cyathus striatus]|nr:hypothetical protein BDQ17DRAFT_1326455 [Cyathus striatus]
MPPEALEYIRDNINWLTPAAMMERIQTHHPEVTRVQVQTAVINQPTTIINTNSHGKYPSSSLLLIDTKYMPPGSQLADPVAGPPANGTPPAMAPLHTSPPTSQATATGTRTQAMASGTPEQRFKSPDTTRAFLAAHQYWLTDAPSLTPKATSTLLTQILAVLPKSPKVPIDAIHALATILQFEDWDCIAHAAAKRAMAHYTQSMDPCTAATTAMQETTQQLQKDPNAIGLTAPSYTLVAATVAAPHAQAIASGEQQDQQFKVRLPSPNNTSKHALANLTPQELVAKANLALDHMEIAATD